jgi:hypothetical protein
MFKKASEGVCTSTGVVSPDPLSPIPSTSPDMKTPEHTDDNLIGPEPGVNGDIQNKILLFFVKTKYRGSNKKLPVRSYVSTGSV